MQHSQEITFADMTFTLVQDVPFSKKELDLLANATVIYALTGNDDALAHLVNLYLIGDQTFFESDEGDLFIFDYGYITEKQDDFLMDNGGGYYQFELDEETNEYVKTFKSGAAA